MDDSHIKSFDAPAYDRTFVHPMGYHKRDHVSLEIAHLRLMHMDMKRIVKQMDMDKGSGIILTNKARIADCLCCKVGRGVMQPRSGEHVPIGDKPFERVLMDCFISKKKANSGVTCLLGILDTYTNKGYLYRMKSQKETIDYMPVFLGTVRHLGYKLGILVCDNALAFVSKKCRELINNASRQELVAPYSHTPMQPLNHWFLTIANMARSAMEHAQAPSSLYDYALVYANCVKGAMLSKGGKCEGVYSPDELLTDNLPDLGKFRVWGCTAMINIPKELRTKFSKRAQEVIFLGFAEAGHGYLFLSRSFNRTYISTDAIFYENDFVFKRVPDSKPLEMPDTRSMRPARYAPKRTPTVLDAEETEPEVETTHAIDDSYNISLPCEEDIHIEDDTDEEDEGRQPYELRSRGPAAGKGLVARKPKVIPQASGAHVKAPFLTQDLTKEHAQRLEALGLKWEPLTRVPETDMDFEQVKIETVLQSTNRNHWLASCQKEANSIIKKEVLEAEFFNRTTTKHVPNRGDTTMKPSLRQSPVVGLNFRSRVKKDKDHKWESDKSRLIALGYTQIKGKNYFETFYNAVSSVYLRVLCAIACAFGLAIYHIDVSTAFLYAPMTEVVYVDCIPNGDLLDLRVLNKQTRERLIDCLKFQKRFRPGDEKETTDSLLDREGWICKYRLVKSLYGTHHAGRNFDIHSRAVFKKIGLIPLACDPHVLVRHGTNGGTPIYMAQMTDDLLVIAKPNDPLLISLVDDLRTHFEITFSLVEKYGGIKITQDLEKGIVFMDLKAMTLAMGETYEVSPKMRQICPITKEDHSKLYLPSPYCTKEKQMIYQSAVPTAQFIVCATRPDLAKAQCILAQWCQNPTVFQFEVMKKYLGHMIGTADYGILFKRTGEPNIDLKMHWWTDADFAGNVQTARSTSGYCTQICGGLVSWGSHFQKAVVLNVMEAELQALTDGGKQFLYETYLFEELGLPLDQPGRIWIDNKSAIQLTDHSVFHGRSKHINVKMMWMREKVAEQIFYLAHVPTIDNVSDIMTKLFNGPEHRRQRDRVVCRYNPSDH